MKILGFVFLVLLLVIGGIVIVRTGLWDIFVNWISSIFK